MLQVHLLKTPMYMYKCFIMYLKCVCLRLYVSMALVSLTCVVGNRASVELEQGKKRNLARKTAGNLAVYLARSWPDTLPDYQGKLKKISVAHCLKSGQ